MDESVGVDGWKRGWIAIVLQAGAFERAISAETLLEIDQSTPDGSVLGVDMPIGFPTRGAREADLAARSVLGGRRSSIFMVPPRSILEAPTYESARRLAAWIWDQGVSAQSFALRKKVLEVNDSDLGGRLVIEVHPEVCFRMIAGQPLPHSKKTWNGQQHRRHLLESVGIVIPQLLPGAAGEVPVDDVLDAAVVAWTADRFRRGVARFLPATADPKAVPTIWY